TGTITIDGSAVSVGPTAAGQDLRRAVKATTANQQGVMYVTGVTNPSAYAKILKPDGSQQALVPINNNPAGQTFFMDTQTLVTVGTYTVFVQHIGTNIGSETVQLKSVPADITGTIAIDGSAVSVGPTAAGQDVRLTFTTTTANQQVVMYVTGVTNPSAYAKILKPDGSQQASVPINNNPAGQTFFMDTQTLATVGTYTAFVQHIGANAGSETLQLKSASDVTGTIAIDGPAVT